MFSVLSKFPAAILTEELCLKAVAKHGGSLYFVPPHLKTEAVCMAAVSNDGNALKYVPVQTESICLRAVQQNGESLSDVAPNHKTELVCFAAVQQHGMSIRHVPATLCNHNMFRTALSSPEPVLRYIPSEYRTAELCTIAIVHCANNLPYVPADLITESLLLAGDPVQIIRGLWATSFKLPESVYLNLLNRIDTTNQSLLEFIPISERTYEVCLAAVKIDRRAINYVPGQHKTYQMYLIAVKRSPYCIESIPEQFKTAEMLMAALE